MSHELSYYNGGENHHDLSQIYKNCCPEQRIFPVGMFLFKHENGRLVLFDTGYPKSMDSCGLRGKAYIKALPYNTSESHDIKFQLEADGISTDDISDVVLSHLHPDHIGGIRHFQNANFIMSEGVASTMRKPRLRDGFFRQLVPAWFDDAKQTVLDSEQLRSGDHSYLSGFDILGDESFLIKELPGHAKGQLGALVVSSVLLAADAAWGRDLLENSEDLRLLPRLITHDFVAYLKTAERLRRIAANGIRVCFSHDVYNEEVIV